MSLFNWATSSFSLKILVFEFAAPILPAEGVCQMEHGPYPIHTPVLTSHVMPF
jgi:hypothetical protein